MSKHTVFCSFSQVDMSKHTPFFLWNTEVDMSKHCVLLIFHVFAHLVTQLAILAHRCLSKKLTRNSENREIWRKLQGRPRIRSGLGQFEFSDFSDLVIPTRPHQVIFCKVELANRPNPGKTIWSSSGRINRHQPKSNCKAINQNHIIDPFAWEVPCKTGKQGCIVLCQLINCCLVDWRLIGQLDDQICLDGPCLCIRKWLYSFWLTLVWAGVASCSFIFICF